MVVEKSCGAVVFTEVNNIRKYVIICSTSGIYGFPKGHMENGEIEEETALREIKEETNLDVNILDGFRTIEEHTFYKGNEKRLKRVAYFIAKYENQKFKPQESEISNIRLMDYDEAMKSFQYDNSKRVLKEVEDFLNKE